MMFWLTKHGLDRDALLSWSPTASNSQGCCLIELDEWTVTRTKQVDPPLRLPRPLLTQTHTQRHKLTNAERHTDHCSSTSSSKESVQLQGETWQRRDQLSSRQITRMWEAWSFFRQRFENQLLSATDNWTPPIQPSVYGTVHFKGTLITKLFGCWGWLLCTLAAMCMCSCEIWDDSYN